MIRILIYILVGGYLFYKIRQFFSKKPIAETSLSSQQNDQEEALVEDPVCHTFVVPQEAYTETIDGKKEFFCSEECAKKFISQQMN